METLLQNLAQMNVGSSSALLVNLGSVYGLQELSSQREFSLDPRSAFTSPYGTYGAGGCLAKHGRRAPEYMKAPYITTTSDSIEAKVTGSAINGNACIY